MESRWNHLKPETGFRMIEIRWHLKSFYVFPLNRKSQVKSILKSKEGRPDRINVNVEREVSPISTRIICQCCLTFRRFNIVTSVAVLKVVQT